MFNSFILAQANNFLVVLSKHEVPGFQQFAYIHMAGGNLSPSCNKAAEDEQSVWFSGDRHCFKLKS